VGTTIPQNSNPKEVSETPQETLLNDPFQKSGDNEKNKTKTMQLIAETAKLKRNKAGDQKLNKINNL
jgi:hypothetical protein